MGQHEGLGLLPGKCVRFPSSERVPQIGWNQISIRRQDPLLESVPDKSFFYFVHSYYVKTDYVKTDDVETEREDDCIATTDYGLDYLSIAGRGHVLGVQFHPEKSQQHGLRLLENFARMR
jgi:glutamine amidotransferase